MGPLENNQDGPSLHPMGELWRANHSRFSGEQRCHTDTTQSSTSPRGSVRGSTFFSSVDLLWIFSLRGASGWVREPLRRGVARCSSQTTINDNTMGKHNKPVPTSS